MTLLSLYSIIQFEIEEAEKKLKSPPHLDGGLFREKTAVKTAWKLQLLFWKTAKTIVRFFALLFGDSSENFLIFTKLGKDSVFVCNNSYCQYKRFQKGVRFFTKTAFAMVLICTVTATSILYFFMPGKPFSFAATFTWIQTDWSGGADGGVYPNHTFNQSGWTKYSEKDANADVSTVGEAKISSTSSSTIDTSTADFNAGSNSSTTVSDSNVKLELVRMADISTSGATDLSVSENCTAVEGTLNNGKCDWTPSNGSSISGRYYNVGTFTITSGYTVNITAYNGSTGGKLEIHADTVNIAGTLNGDAKGYLGGAGGAAGGSAGSQGKGLSNNTIYGGSYGSSGGSGGAGSTYGGTTGGTGGTSQGNTYGTSDGTDIDMGGGGGGGGGRATTACCSIPDATSGNAGGGSVYFYTTNNITASGNITVNGGTGGNGGYVVDGSGTAGGGGGGSGAAGGGILLNGDNIIVSGVLTANRGAGGSRGGCYGAYCDGSEPYGSNGSTGGSGRVKLFYYSSLGTTGSTITATGYNTSYSGCNSGSIYCTGSVTYYSSGTFTSRIIDTGQKNTSWGNTSWTTTQPSSATQIVLKARTSNSATMTGATAFSSCNAIATVTITNATGSAALAGNNCVSAGDRYIQYEAALSTTDATITPVLSDVTINYTYYSTSQTLTSSAYNTQSSANILSKIQWAENLPSNTDVKFQVRTAPDVAGAPGTWSDWCGPDNGGAGCSTTTYFTDPTGDEIVDADFKDGAGDQWVQYKIWFESDGANTPTVSDFTLTYVVNASPVVSNVTASQGTDGIISISYDLSDEDNSSFAVSALADIGVTLNEELTSSDATAITVSNASFLPSSGTIQIDNEQISYTSKSGNNLQGTVTRGANNTEALSHSSGTAVWIKGSTVSGNVGASQTAGTGKSISWTIKTDLNGVYYAASKIRVSANDGNAANQVGNGDSIAFTLDTKDPVPGANPILIDAALGLSLTTLALDAADDTALEMKISNNADLSADGVNTNSGTWISYASTKSWILSANPDTVYAQFKDSKGNTTAIQSLGSLPIRNTL